MPTWYLKPEQIAELLDLYESGLGYVKVAKKMGVHRATVRYWVRKNGMEREGPGDYARLKMDKVRELRGGSDGSDG